jgi:hypothetical protein
MLSVEDYITGMLHAIASYVGNCEEDERVYPLGSLFDDIRYSLEQFRIPQIEEILWTFEEMEYVILCGGCEISALADHVRSLVMDYKWVHKTDRLAVMMRKRMFANPNPNSVGVLHKLPFDVFSNITAKFV